MTGFVSKKRMAESRFAMITEDPTYDEDLEWEDDGDVLKYLDKELKDFDEGYSPFGTVNS
jgi:hypothetical protein